MRSRLELSETWVPAIVIGLTLVAVFLPALILPYYFVDDLWLYRRPDLGFPDVIEVVAFRQGRPIFAALAFVMQELRARMGVEAMLVARLIAVVSLAVFAYCIYLFTRLWHSPLTALCVSILLVTLPSFQMYVTAAPLFAPSLAYCGLVVLLFGHFVSRETNTRRQSAVLLWSTIGLVLVWATYQGLPLVVVSLLTPLLLSERWRSDPRWRRVGVFLFGVGVSLVLYYVLWLLANAGIPSDNRYSPKALGLNLREDLGLYRSDRIPEIFGFWDTRRNGGSHFYGALAIVAGAFALDVVSTGTRRSRRALLWILPALLIIAVDVPLFFAPPSNTFSYMTSAPSAAATFLLVAMAAVQLLRGLEAWAPAVQRIAGLGAALLCTAAAGFAAANVLMNHVLPTWLEYALVRSELRHELQKASNLSSVTVFARDSLLAQGRSEFFWGNFDKSFWVHWAIRDALDELGADSRIGIEVVNSDGSLSILPQSLQAESINPRASGRRVTIDLRGMDLSNPAGTMLRQPPPMPGYENYFVRRRAQRNAPDVMGHVPAVLTTVPIEGIRSTLTYTGNGARGERAAVDGNLLTSAADPKGFHNETRIDLSLGKIVDISGVRILSAKDYGIEIAGTMRVSCDTGDGRFQEAAVLALRPGTQVISEAYWDKQLCRGRLLRLEATGVAAATNFWIAEIQVFSRPSLER
jgi:hypothetical protein